MSFYNLFNHSNTSLKTTFWISLFFSLSVLMANFRASGLPTLEQATYSCPCVKMSDRSQIPTCFKVWPKNSNKKRLLQIDTYLVICWWSLQMQAWRETAFLSMQCASLILQVLGWTWFLEWGLSYQFQRLYTSGFCCQLSPQRSTLCHCKALLWGQGS